MKCAMCDNPNKLTEKTLATYKYKDSGLENVILHGVKVCKCERCGEEYFDLGNVDKLHDLIARTLIQKSITLTGTEVRFLRKHLGYSGNVFAKLVGYENTHLSKIENGKLDLTETFDRLVRMLVSEKLPNRKYVMQDLFLENKLMALEWLEFSLSAHEWRLDSVKAS